MAEKQGNGNISGNVPSVLEASSVHFSYGKRTVLQDISFQLSKGETLGIIGPNGSGKSTLLKLLSGVVPPASGKIRWMDKPLESFTRKKLAQHIAVLTQEPLPDIAFTVKEVLEMGRFPHRNRWGEDSADFDLDRFIAPIIKATGIEGFLHRPLTALSGGERQRVAMAKAMVQQPSLLMLDEPTTFLDIGYQVQTLRMVKEWQRESQLSVLIVLHDLNLAAHVCDRLLLLNDGRIAAEGTPSEVLKSQTIDPIYHVHTEITPHPVNSKPQIWVTL